MVNCVEIPENSLLDNILLVSVLISRYIRATRWANFFLNILYRVHCIALHFQVKAVGHKQQTGRPRWLDGTATECKL